MTDKELIDKIIEARKAKRQSTVTGLKIYFDKYVKLDKEIEAELERRSPEPVIAKQMTLFHD